MEDKMQQIRKALDEVTDAYNDLDEKELAKVVGGRFAEKEGLDCQEKVDLLISNYVG